jgi:hypothetical protein
MVGSISADFISTNRKFDFRRYQQMVGAFMYTDMLVVCSVVIPFFTLPLGIIPNVSNNLKGVTSFLVHFMISTYIT